MKQKLTILLLVLFSFSINAQVFITEIADPNNLSTLPGTRYIELYNAGSVAVDFTENAGWRIDKYTNASATVSQTLALSGTIQPNSFYIIATGTDDGEFFTVYGINADQFDGADNDVAGSNGDDNLELYDGSDVLIDQFGVPGEDGSGTNHEFEDGRAERNASVITGNAIWDVTEWTIDNDGSTFPGDGHQDAPAGFDPAMWIAATTPSVSNISILPVAPSSADAVVVSATITDDIAVTGANLYWSLTSPVTTSDNPTAMTNVLTVYSATIGTQADGTTVYYMLDATDGTETTTTSEMSYTVSDNYSVTFNVDMTDSIASGYFVEGTDQLWVAGSMNGWTQPGDDAAYELTESATNDIYTVTVSVGNGDHEYKYFKIIGGVSSWDNGEWQGGANRAFTVSGADVTLDDIFGNETGAAQVATIADLRAGTAGNLYELTGEAILTFQQSYRSQKWIEDATGAILIDDNDGFITTTYNQYDGISGIIGTLNVYNGLSQFIPIMDSGAASSTGNTVTPQVVDIATLLAGVADYESEIVTIEMATFDEADGSLVFATGTNYSLTDASDNFNFRTNYYDVDYIGTVIPSVANVTAIVGNYNGTAQITSRDLADIEEVTVYTVTFNVDMTDSIASGFFVEGTDQLWVGGSMNGWTMPGDDAAYEMFESGTDDIYTLTITPEDGDYMYKYFKIVGGVSNWDLGEWTGDPNREFTFASADLVLDDLFGDKPLSITDLSAKGISVYPNPSNGVFTLNVENNFNLEVFDITGKVIKTRTLTGNTTLELNTAGVYFLRFSNEKGSVTQRVIVQ